MRILLADSDPTFRRFLRKTLESQAQYRVIGEARDCGEILEAAKRGADLALIALSLPYRGGLEATRAIKAMQPGMRILIFAEAGGESYREAVRRAGAEGLLAKDTEAAAILHGVQAALLPAA